MKNLNQIVNEVNTFINMGHRNDDIFDVLREADVPSGIDADSDADADSDDSSEALKLERIRIEAHINYVLRYNLSSDTYVVSPREDLVHHGHRGRLIY